MTVIFFITSASGAPNIPKPFSPEVLCTWSYRLSAMFSPRLTTMIYFTTSSFGSFGFTTLTFLWSSLLPKYVDLHHVSFWIQWSRFLQLSRLCKNFSLLHTNLLKLYLSDSMIYFHVSFLILTARIHFTSSRLRRYHSLDTFKPLNTWSAKGFQRLSFMQLSQISWSGKIMIPLNGSYSLIVKFSVAPPYWKIYVHCLSWACSF